MKEQVAWLYPAILTVFALGLLLEIVGGRVAWSRATLKGGLFALCGVAAHAVLAAPVIGLVLGLLFQHVFPGSAEALVGAPFWLAFPLYFVSEEFCHYWVHRWAHEKRWLWKLHRTHHSAERLNTLVLYRYNLFWTLLLPQSWFAAAAVHLGLYEVFVVSTLITFSVNALTHTAYRWDLALRGLPGMEPLFPRAGEVHHAARHPPRPPRPRPLRARPRQLRGDAVRLRRAARHRAHPSQAPGAFRAARPLRLAGRAALAALPTLEPCLRPPPVVPAPPFP